MISTPRLRRALTACFVLAFGLGLGTAPAAADQPILAGTLLALGEECLRARLTGLPPEGVLYLESVFVPEEVRVRDGAVTFDVQLSDARPAAVMSPVCRILVDGALARSVPVPFRLRLVAPRLRAERALAAGETIDAGAMRTVVEAVPLPWGDHLASFTQIGLRVPRRLVQAGEPLRADMLEEPALVHAGEPVVLELESSTVRILARGIARQAGRMGDRIRVVRDGTKRPITARVSGPNRVRISVSTQVY